MPASSRFAVASHILAMLTRRGGGPLPSDEIATSVNTDPSVVRRLLGMLARAGLTASQYGSGGGAMLARKPADITLLDVYRATEAGPLVAMHHSPPNHECSVGRHIQPVLAETAARAQEAFEAELAGVTVAELDVRLRAAMRRGAPR